MSRFSRVLFRGDCALSPDLIYRVTKEGREALELPPSSTPQSDREGLATIIDPEALG